MIVFILTLVTGGLLLLANLIPFVPPSISSSLQLLGLAFPILFLLNLLWLFYWWFQLKLKLLIPLCFGIFSLYGVSKYAQYTTEKKRSGPALKIATYNTQLFGVYQKRWFFDSISKEIENQKFDVVCLQEVFAQKDLEKQMRKLQQAGGFKYGKLFKLTPTRNYGMMILSKHPIIHSGRIDFPGATGNMAMYSDLLINDLDTLRVYNVHLQSIRFRKTDYDFVSGNENGKKSNLEQGKGLLRRMLDAYGKRANQAEVMVEHIKTTPYPVMVCGDFNDVPLSYAYQTMSRNLLDAFREAGNGIERTYKGPFPSFRIDYILFSRKLACKAYHSSEQVPGDHKLVWAELEISSSAYRK